MLPWLLIAAIPPIFAMATWQTSWSYGPVREWLRQLGAPAVAVEIFVIGWSIWLGLEPLGVARRQPRWVRACLIGLIGIALATASFIAPNTITASTWTFIWLVHLGFGLSIYRLVSTSDDRAKAAIWPAVIVGLCAYALLVVAFVFSVPKGAFNWERFPLAGSNIRHVGYYSAIGGAAALGLAAVRAGWPRIACSLAAAIMIALSFWSGTRGSIVALWAAFACGALILPRLRTIGNGLLLAGSTIAGALISLAGPTPNSLFGMGRVAASFAAPSANDVASGRLTMWADAWSAVLRQPWFGYGQGQFPAVVGSQNLFNQPHNILLQLLLQWGFAGTALALALAACLFARGRNALRAATDNQVPALLVAGTLLTMSLYDGTLFYSYPTMMFVLALAVLLGEGNQRRT